MVLVVLRVVFVALPLLSIGFLAWVSTLWAAIVTRRAREWWVFAATVAALVTSFSFLAQDDTDDFSTPAGTTGMIILLLNACVCAGWFLYADVRHYQRPYYPIPVAPYPPAAGYAYAQPTQPAQPPRPYGPVPPQAPVPQPQSASMPQIPQPPQAPLPQTPVPPPPQHPAPARIDQVRAELDELSDYLRRHGGSGGSGTPEGGR
ncbi:hypothetical protein [Streptomyces sp. MA25(2023)]|uniref:hypothetical protein n=1 Tax=Streptomyces TaxID=1883 RepID=UPI0025B11CC2|nr:hypothetical protein [Streptomyces sp. MA25(2023)]MDN3255390.1 hypothetical protein [Streptomyces sp. MA25(2023)]